jgi:hypothetical protein
LVSPCEEILGLIGSPVAYRYEPVVRDLLEPSPENIERIRFYSTIPFGVGDHARRAKAAWYAAWTSMTRDLSPDHVRSLESRGLQHRLHPPPEGAPVDFGPTKEEYDEMDRLGLLAWEESYRANEVRALTLAAAFLGLSFNEQVTCARWYKNAAAWGVFEKLLTPEDRMVIESEVCYLDREEDELERREHEWDD